MGRTLVQISSEQILAGGIVRASLNTTTIGSSLIRRVLQGTNISFTSTGADTGTGDVTISSGFTVSDLSTVGTTAALDFSVASFYTFQTTSAITCTVSFSVNPANGSLVGFRVKGPAAGTSNTLTLPAIAGSPVFTAPVAGFKDILLWFDNGVYTLIPTPATNGIIAFDAGATVRGGLTINTGALSLLDTAPYIDSTVIAAGSAPAAPASVNMRQYATALANKPMLAVLGSSGAARTMQGLLGQVQARLLAFANNSSTPSTLCCANFSLTNGLGATAVSTGNGIFGRATRASISTSAVAGNISYLGYSTAGDITVAPSTGGQGGFLFVTRFGPADTVSGARKFVGLSSSTAAPTNVDPAAGLNQIGIAQISTSNNMQVVYGGSAAQTAIDLGTNFPMNTANTDWYELVLFCPTNSNNIVYYQVTRLNTGNVASGTLTGTAGTALPASTTFLAPRYWITNNATAQIAAMGIGEYYIETDY